jgi:hypothetical protein
MVALRSPRTILTFTSWPTPTSSNSLVRSERRRTGRTFYDGGDFFSSPETSADSDWSYARITIAGLVAEVVFDYEDFREGSSIDEVCQARIYAHNISVKTGVPAEDVWNQVFDRVRAALLLNGAAVLEIAAVLVRRGSIRGADVEKIVRRRR